jgi:hypothetical protein
MDERHISDHLPTSSSRRLFGAYSFIFAIIIINNATGCYSLQKNTQPTLSLSNTSINTPTNTSTLYFTVTPLSITLTKTPTSTTSFTSILFPKTEWPIKLSYDIRLAENDNSIIDLDTMEIMGNTKSDLEFKVQGGTDLFSGFIPLNGATLLSIGPEEISPKQCNEYSLTKFASLEIFIGNQFCVKSTKGQLFLVKVVNYLINMKYIHVVYLLIRTEY